MPSTEQFAEQRMTILKHLQKELFSLLATKDLGLEEIQTIHDEMRELSQAVLIYFLCLFRYQLPYPLPYSLPYPLTYCLKLLFIFKLVCISKYMFLVISN